jgi:hypothetical protein
MLWWCFLGSSAKDETATNINLLSTPALVVPHTTTE